MKKEKNLHPYPIMIKSLLPVIFSLVFTTLCGQETIRYKQIDTVNLYLEIYRPEKKEIRKPLPAIVFFFGGGWRNGDRHHFLEQAKYFSKRNMVCILADYRTESKHGTSPFIALEDAKTAMRYVRSNADDLGIDPNRITASGGSAGGHLAAATAFIQKYNDPNDDISVDCKPNALILFNPVIDNGPAGYGYERIGSAYKDFSPLHNIQKDPPPTIFFLGTKDRYIPVETAAYYQTVMEKTGGRCEIHIYKDKIHGFFNPQFKDMYKETVFETDKFLQSLGYLNKQSKIKVN